MRTKFPDKSKRVIAFIHHFSEKWNFGSWIYLPSFTSEQMKPFKLHPIKDYMQFRMAEKQGLIRMKYNESYAILTLVGKKVAQRRLANAL